MRASVCGTMVALVPDPACQTVVTTFVMTFVTTDGASGWRRPGISAGPGPALARGRAREADAFGYGRRACRCTVPKGMLYCAEGYVEVISSLPPCLRSRCSPPRRPSQVNGSCSATVVYKIDKLLPVIRAEKVDACRPSIGFVLPWFGPLPSYARFFSGGSQPTRRSTFTSGLTRLVQIWLPSRTSAGTRQR